MDLLVLQSQVYLNNKYGGRYGYTPVTVNGRTGWPTMYALTRALQIELGIGAPSDGFGPTTMATFEAKYGTIGSSTGRRELITLLQCALWCKGYNGGSLESGWTDTIAGSVATVRLHMGFDPDPAEVTTKILKSLFSMDAYVALPGGNEAVRQGQQWLNRRYVSRKNFHAIPCDGLFTRQMQTAMMFAIQFELGMSDEQANGNFGPGTSAGLSSRGLVGRGSRDSNTNFVRLFQLALCCNSYVSTLDGVFGTETGASARDFQEFMEIEATGTGDFGTWAALLISTGDPNRPVTGVDTTSEITQSFAARLKAEGYTTVGRYLTVADKSIRPGEIDVILDSGLSLVPIFQNYNNDPSYFDSATGRDHGYQAALRARQLGLGDNVCIFFAVDYDATGDEASTIVLDYFAGIRTGLLSSLTVRYKIGIYATRNVAAIVRDAGYAEVIWVSGMSTGYSGNLGFRMPTDWAYNQIQEVHAQNIDRNVVSVRAKPATRVDIKPTPDKNGGFHPFFWTIVEKQVLAERIITESSTLLPTGYASQMVLFWLQRGSYEGGHWAAYTPYPETSIRPDLPLHQSYVHARQAFFEAAGARETIVDRYEGGEDVKHMAATAHAVLNWGAGAGDGSMQIGDLGGWGMDFVDLWHSYHTIGRDEPIQEWVFRNLGGSSESGFGFSDLLADADGWLIGTAMLSKKVELSEAWRLLLVQSLTPEKRIAAFLTGRFGQAPRTNLTSCLRSVFTGPWPWQEIPRSIFQKDAPDPTARELSELVEAATERLLQLGAIR